MAEPTALGCPCGSDRLSIVHSMGAQVYCPKCDRRGPFVPGHNYQQEEAAAIRAWNESITAGVQVGSPQQSLAAPKTVDGGM